MNFLINFNGDAKLVQTNLIILIRSEHDRLKNRVDRPKPTEPKAVGWRREGTRSVLVWENFNPTFKKKLKKKTDIN